MIQLRLAMRCMLCPNVTHCMKIAIAQMLSIIQAWACVFGNRLSAVCQHVRVKTVHWYIGCGATAPAGFYERAAVAVVAQKSCQNQIARHVNDIYARKWALERTFSSVLGGKTICECRLFEMRKTPYRYIGQYTNISALKEVSEYFIIFGKGRF